MSGITCGTSTLHVEHEINVLLSMPSLEHTVHRLHVSSKLGIDLYLSDKFFLLDLTVPRP